MQQKKWTLDVESNQYDLVQGRFYLIGYTNEEGIREDCADIKIKSQSVDPKHCLIDFSADALYLYDLRSKLGTFLNGKRLDPMLKKCITTTAELRFGEVQAQLYLKEDTLDLTSSSTDTFLAPTQRAPRSSLANTSTRLFSSPDVSLLGDTRDESFNIPDTQHIKRVSMENLNMANTSGNQSDDDRNVEDESFIPETQMITAEEGAASNNELESNLYKSSEMIRINTQDFNENLFENAEDDGMLFSSIVIPNIKHNPVILTHSSINEQINKDTSKATSSCDAEMEALNWSAQTSKNITSDGTTLNFECVERDNICTPDLFDLPELAQINIEAAVERTNMNLDELAMEAPDIITNKSNWLDAQALPIEDRVAVGDGYAEEIELMPTQLFVPVAKNKESHLQAAVTIANGELSLSGKENIPQADISLEPTQIFAPVKDGKAVESKCIALSSNEKEPSTYEPSDRNINLLPPTEVFPCNLSNSVLEAKKLNQKEKGNGSNTSTTQQNPKSTLVPNVEDEGSKSVAGSLVEIENTSKMTKTEEEKLATKKRGSFKKPKQSTSSSRSVASRGSKEKHSSINSTQSEIEDLHLCTPKWISDNFDEISIDRNISSVKKHILFGSDSEEESVELNKLITKKDSKDFEILLSNVKEAQSPTKVAQSKNILVKKESPTDLSKTKNIEIPNRNLKDFIDVEKSNVKKPEKVEHIKKEKSSNKKIKRPEEKVSKSNAKLTETKETTVELKVHKEKESEIIKKHSEHKEIKQPKNGVTKDDEKRQAGVPCKRMTRLRSRASNLEIDNASSSGASPAKQRKIEHIEEPETSKKRLTRSHSKTESQESISSTKSTGSSRGRRKSSREHKTQSKTDTSHDKSTAEAVTKPTKATERKESRGTQSASVRNSKGSGDVPSDNETKQLANNPRTLQVAMTMVESKLFQSLVDNSPGNWCIASDPTDADVLVMDKGNRTLKFLIAMAKGIPIVTSKWLDSLNSTKTVPRGVIHFFRDQEFEKRHKFSLFKSLEMARKSKLFEGFDFLTTPGILPQPAEMKQILECAGGKVHSEPPPPKPNQKIFLISTLNDKKYWHKYRRFNNNIRITDSEGVMASVMRQSTQPLESKIFA